MKNRKTLEPKAVTLSIANAANDLHRMLSEDFCLHIVVPAVAELAEKAMIYRNPDLIVMEVLRHYVDVCVEELEAKAKRKRKKPKPASKRMSK
jgi:hypothetical protein